MRIRLTLEANSTTNKSTTAVCETCSDTAAKSTYLSASALFWPTVLFSAALLISSSGEGAEGVNNQRDSAKGSTHAATDKPDILANKPTELPNFPLKDLAGETVRVRSLPGDRATILVFVSTGCPIVQSYVPALNRFATDFSEQGVKVVAVADPDQDDPVGLRKFCDDYQTKFAVYREPDGKLAAALGASVTPEVFLFDSQLRVVYQGRIDDRFARRGQAPREAQEPDLRRALEQLLTGLEITTPLTTAVGCPLAVTRPRLSEQPAGLPPVTYGGQIAPLLNKHCHNCHRPEGVAPFDLSTYQHAVAWAEDIRDYTARRVMPPWKPVAGQGEFLNRRAMSDAEIALIAAWVNGGCAEGPAIENDVREVLSTWQLGTPDLILSPDVEIELPSEGRDIYRCFVLDPQLAEDQFVRAIEVLPGNSRVVHHVIAFVDTSDKSRQLDQADPGPGYVTTAGFPGFLPAGGVGGWAPGNLPRELPAGMGRPLPRGAKVVLQVHYHLTGKPESDRTRLGLYFARKEDVTRAVRSLAAGPIVQRLTGTLSPIPAGAAAHQVQCSIKIPRDVIALSVTPHMHLIGKEMQVRATFPDGHEIPLIYVKDWDFNWQESYTFREPIALPAGTRIDVRAVYDNSAQNPANPHHPPQDVRWGEQTTNEMCFAFLEVAPQLEAKSPADLALPTPQQRWAEVLRAVSPSVRKKLQH